MYEEIINQAREYYSQKKYKEALDTFETILNYNKSYFEVYTDFIYMWSIFRVIINDEHALDDANSSRTYKYANYLVSKSSPSDKIYEYTVMRMIKHLKNAKNYNAEIMNEWLDKIDPESLSDEYPVNNEGKELPSQREEWYSQKTKAVEKLGKFDECLAISQEALENVNKFHNNNDIWIKRRIAISRMKLGDAKGAIPILCGIVRTKKDWFIYHNLGSAYNCVGNTQKAIECFMKAVVSDGKDENKVKLYGEIAETLDELDDKENAQSFKDYRIKLKLDAKWSLLEDERVYISENQERLDAIDIKKLRNEIRDISNKYLEEYRDKYMGRITKVFDNKLAGFILGDNSTSYYFRAKDISNPSIMNVGQRVVFNLEASFDKSKNRETECAVNIKAI